MSLTRRAVLGGLAALPFAARAADGIVVLAASSLTEGLQRVGDAWATSAHVRPTFSFDASSRLARQIEAGVAADVFVSADRDWMDYLEARTLIDRSTRGDLVGNRLVVVVPAANPLVLAAPADLARVTHLALGGENVPVGKYARTALDRSGAWSAVRDHVVTGDDARSVLAWVATGQADAGVVYATDARIEPRVRVAYTFPAELHAPIVYPGAVVSSSARSSEARSFLEYCRGEGRRLLLDAGFVAP